MKNNYSRVLLSSRKDYSNKNNINNITFYPDKIEQIDKVINKYKDQLEQLKPQKDLYEGSSNIHQYLSFNRKKNKNSELTKNDSEPYTYKYSRNYKKNNQYYKTTNDYTNEENDDSNKNKYNNNLKYKYKNNLYKNINKNKNNNISCDLNDLNNEIEIDNIKLGSALTLEKTKVAELLNMLKKKIKK